MKRFLFAVFAAASLCLNTSCAPAAQPSKEVLFFTTEGCDPCEQFKAGPLKKLADVNIRTVENESLAKKFNVRLYPTFVLTYHGKEVDRRVGYQTAKQVRAFYNRSQHHHWRRAAVKIGNCSGVCIHPRGVILTVKHCNLKEREQVKLDGKVVWARWKYECEERDGPVIYLVEGGRTNYPYLKLGSTSPKPGDKVYSLGYPGWWNHNFYMFTEGVARGYAKYEGVNYLWTKQRILGGNSGGPLVNAKGEVVGLVARSRNDTGVNMYGFSTGSITLEAIHKSIHEAAKQSVSKGTEDKSFAVIVTGIASALVPLIPMIVEELLNILRQILLR